MTIASKAAGVLQLFRRGNAAPMTNYDATESSGRRKSPPVDLRSEDRILSNDRRMRLTANQRDIRRNFAIVGWAIRKHLDYNSTFAFQAKTSDKSLNAQLDSFMKWYSRPSNCDAARRHGLPAMIRIAEEMRVLDGDVFFLKLKSGSLRGKLQGVEGDRVKNPGGTDSQQFVHGVKIDAAGGALAYSIYRRLTYGGMEFERVVPAGAMLSHGFYDRFDQVRGISPLAAAVNSFRDVYEGMDAALAKAKVSQLFGLGITRATDTDPDASDDLGTVPDPSGPVTDDDPTTDPAPRYALDMTKGPFLADLDPGDDVKVIESHTPSNEFQQYMRVVLASALKGLDIPFSFFDESFTNFYGSRGAFMQYMRSCEPKQAAVRDLLRKITVWRLGLAIEDGVIDLPSGWTMEDVTFDWVPLGVPWWDPTKDLSAAVMGINAGLSTRTQVVKERYGGGTTFEEIIDKLAEEEAYIRERGVSIVSPGPNVYNQPAVVPAGAQDGGDDAAE